MKLCLLSGIKYRLERDPSGDIESVVPIRTMVVVNLSEVTHVEYGKWGDTIFVAFFKEDKELAVLAVENMEDTKLASIFIRKVMDLWHHAKKDPSGHWTFKIENLVKEAKEALEANERRQQLINSINIH